MVSRGTRQVFELHSKPLQTQNTRHLFKAAPKFETDFIQANYLIRTARKSSKCSAPTPSKSNTVVSEPNCPKNRPKATKRLQTRLSRPQPSHTCDPSRPKPPQNALPAIAHSWRAPTAPRHRAVHPPRVSQSCYFPQESMGVTWPFLLYCRAL